MKKFLAIALILALCLAALPAFSESSWTALDLGGMKLSIPSDMDALYYDMPADSPILADFDNDVRQAKMYLGAMNMNLMAYPADLSETYYIFAYIQRTNSVSGFENYFATAKSGYGEDAVSSADINGHRFVVADYTGDHIGDPHLYRYEYVLPANGYLYGVCLASDYAPLEEAERQLFESIVQTVEIDLSVVPTHPSSTYSLDEIGLTIEIPDSVLTITRNTPADDFAFFYYGIDHEYLMPYFEENNLYLISADSAPYHELHIYAEPCDMGDLMTSMPDEIQPKLELITSKAIANGGEVTEFSSYYHPDTTAPKDMYTKIIVSNYAEMDGATAIFYSTIKNEMLYQIVYIDYTGNPDAVFEEEILNLIGTIDYAD